MEDHGLAGDQIGGHGPVRDRQAVKLVITLGLGQSPQHGLQLHAGDDSLGQENPGGGAELRAEERFVVLLLASYRPLLAWRVVLEQQLRIDLPQYFLHFGHRAAAGITGADQRTHTGTGNAMNRNAQLFQHLDDPDMGRSTRTAARQNQADFRAFAVAGGDGCLAGLRMQIRSGKQCDEACRQGDHQGVEMGFVVHICSVLRISLPA